MIEKIKEEIKISSELLNTMPKNNIKNRKKYQETLIEVKHNYIKMLTKMEQEINNRYDKYTSVNDGQILGNKLNQINAIKEKLYLLNKYNSAYEKFGFDKSLYKLNHFYKQDLDEVNKNIIDCIKKFEQVGIKITAEDFNYSEYAYSYMKVLLNSPETIKENFEKIYWQCSDLFIHIELNIKYLFYNNKNIFEKYINNEKNDFLKSFTNSPLKFYKELVINYDETKNSSLKRGIDKFLKKQWNINDYQIGKIEKYYQFFTDEEPNYMIDDEINKLMFSAQEYKNFLSFKYIMDDLKKKYNAENNLKNELKNINKKIIKNEKLIYKYNKKKNKKERINIKIINMIKELETLYEKLDEINFYDRLSKHLNDDSSIYDALAFACSHYLYIVKCMKENKIDKPFDVEYKRLVIFLLNAYNNLIMNISIIEERDLALIISDRYKLSNLKVNKDVLSTEEGLNEIIINAKKINIYNKIVSKLSYENLKFIEQVKENFRK